MKFKKTWDLIKNYRWRSVFFSYWKLLIVMFTIPLLIFVTAIYFSYSRTVKNEINNTLMQSFNKTMIGFEKIFTEVDKTYNIFSTNNYVLSFLTMPNSIGNGLETFSNTSRIYELMTNYINTSDYIFNIYLYSPKNEYVLSSTSSNFLDNFYDKNLVIRSSEEFEKTISYNMIEETYECITISYPINLSLENEYDGMLIINIDISKLEGILLGDKVNYYDTIYVIDDDGAIIYSNNHSKIGQNISSNKNLSQIALETTNSQYKVVRSLGEISCSSKLANQNLTIISTIPVEQFSEYINSINLVIICCLLVVLMLSISLSFYTSMRLYNSIAEIVASIEMPFNFTPGSQDSKQFDELIYISNNIMSIMKNNAAIEQELVQKISKLRKAQSIALQTQINPHFIFNTLNLVNIIIMRITKSDNEAAKVISLLSEILHCSLDTNEYLVTVEEEMYYAKKYLEIEQIKTKHSFDIIWQIDEETTQYKTVKLILQPLIENSIEHSFKLLHDKRGLLIIKSELISNQLVFTVTDNGYGIDSEKLEYIRSKLTQDDIQESKHIGLSNVNQRIKLIFGDDYGVKIYSGTDGTTITINMPTR